MKENHKELICQLLDSRDLQIKMIVTETNQTRKVTARLVYKNEELLTKTDIYEKNTNIR